MMKLGATVCWLLALSLVGSIQAQRSKKPTPQVAKALSQLAVTDVAGKRHKPFADKKTKAAVLLFVSTDCPVANAFQPYLRELEKTYAAKGVRCFMVYCSPGLKREAIEKHTKDFRIRMPAVFDVEQKLARTTGAKVTPEAILIDRSGKVRYRGSINNLYAGYGRKRAKPTEHFLRDACGAVIAGKEVAKPVTKPVGCFIHFKTTETKAKK